MLSKNNMEYVRQVNGFALVCIFKYGLCRGVASASLIDNVEFALFSKHLWTVGTHPLERWIWCNTVPSMVSSPPPEHHTGSGSAGSGGQTKPCAFHHICGLMGYIILLEGGCHCHEGLYLVCRTILIGFYLCYTIVKIRRGNICVLWQRPQTELALCCLPTHKYGEQVENPEVMGGF